MKIEKYILGKHNKVSVSGMLIKMFVALMILGLFLALFVPRPLCAEPKTVVWEPPTERADGTKLSQNEIDGYKIYYGTESGKYLHSVNVNDGSAKTFNLDIPDNETHYAVMTTLDTDGRESVRSSEAVLKASTTIPPVTIKPMPPANLVVEQIGSTLEYRFTFTAPTKYDDGSDLVGVVTKYFLFDSMNGDRWIRDVPSDTLSFTRILEEGEYLFNMETEINVNGKYSTSERSLMAAVVVKINKAAPNPPANLH